VTDPTESTDPENEPEVSDEGPGWMPAIMAGTLLMGILGFIFCAFSTWILFQQRTEFAIRTLRGSYIPQIEQSLLEPATKSSVVQQIQSLAADMERGKYEHWQAQGIMQRLQRLPVIQWGELQAIEAFLKTGADAQQDDAIAQLSRLQRAVELGKVTSFDFEQVLEPVRRPDPNAPSGSQLIQPLTKEKIDGVVQLARQVADQAEVPDQRFDGVQIESIVQHEIQMGASEGGF